MKEFVFNFHRKDPEGLTLEDKLMTYFQMIGAEKELAPVKAFKK